MSDIDSTRLRLASKASLACSSPTCRVCRRSGQLLKYGIQRQPRVAVDGKVWPYIASKLTWIDINPDQLAIDNNRAGKKEIVICFAKLGAHCQHHIRLLKLAADDRMRARAPHSQRMTIGNGTLGVNRIDHRRPQLLRQGKDLWRSIDTAPTNGDEGAFSVAQ